MPEPVVIATWKFGEIAVRAALPLLTQGRAALDAALAGAQAVRGRSDGQLRRLWRFGGQARHGVARRLRHGRARRSIAARSPASRISAMSLPSPAASWTRRRTCCWPAKALGFSRSNRAFRLNVLHTPESVAIWEKRRRDKTDRHLTHDTVTVLALDQTGSLGGVCTTSGLSHKLPGRVGDSPIVGAGLYVDDAPARRAAPASARRSCASAAAC